MDMIELEVRAMMERCLELGDGDMPLPQEVKDYHMEKLQSRAKKEGRPLAFDMVVSDLQYASRLPMVQK